MITQKKSLRTLNVMLIDFLNQCEGDRVTAEQFDWFLTLTPEERDLIIQKHSVVRPLRITSAQEQERPTDVIARLGSDGAIKAQ